MLTLKEPIPETKKVSDFLAGIQGGVLATSRDLALGDPVKYATFESVQQSLMLAALTRQTPQSSRGIKRLHQERKGKGKAKEPDPRTRPNLRKMVLLQSSRLENMTMMIQKTL